ncbi:MAG TPA: fumarylacetoacetate hydrolase family protein [Actinomycetota bacterium]|nr:fumarylacetoacetate hydrolase family protein [Actinomycetota bacterium]
MKVEAPVRELAARLFEASRDRRLVPPLTEAHPDLSVAEAYAIQDALLALREEAGERIVGAKLGLTSRAKQRDMGIDEPIYGWLTDAMALDPGAVLEVSTMVQPRAEPEVAFVLGEDLSGRHVTAVHVLAATRWVVPAIEVLDSRYPDYRFGLPDVIADDASAGRFLLGGAGVEPEGIDLRLVGCAFERNGEVLATAAGAAALGHPAAAVAWLVRTLSERDRGLRAGQVVLSGGLTSAVPVHAGDVVTARFDRLGTVELPCR